MYPFKLWNAILIEIRDQLRANGTYKDGFIGLMEFGRERASMAVDDTVYQLKDKHGAIPNVQIGSEVFYRDDLTGQILDPDLIAGAKGLEYFEAKVVWEKRMMPRESIQEFSHD